MTLALVFLPFMYIDRRGGRVGQRGGDVRKTTLRKDKKCQTVKSVGEVCCCLGQKVADSEVCCCPVEN